MNGKISERRPVVLALALWALTAVNPAQSAASEDGFEASLVRALLGRLDAEPPRDPQRTLWLFGLVLEAGGEDFRAPERSFPDGYYSFFDLDRALLESNALAVLGKLGDSGVLSGAEREQAHELIALLEERLGLQDPAAGEATTLTVVEELASKSEWASATRDRGPFAWVLLPVDGLREYELYAEGCDTFGVAVWSDSLSHVANGIAYEEEPMWVGAPDREGALLVRFDADDCAAGELKVAALARVPPAALATARRREEALAVELDRLYRGELGRDEAKWLTFRCPPGRLVEIQTSRLRNELDTRMTLYLGDEELTSDDDGGEEPLASRVRWACQSDGSHLVEIRGFEREPGAFDIELRDLGDAAGQVPLRLQRAAAPAEAPLIQPGEVYDGRLDEGQSQWLRWSASAGRVYRIQTQNLRDGLDTVLRLGEWEPSREPSPTVLLEDDDGGVGSESRIVWQSPGDGDLYLEVFGYDRGGGAFEIEIDEYATREEADKVLTDLPPIPLEASLDRAAAPALVFDETYSVSVRGRGWLGIDCPEGAPGMLTKAAVESGSWAEPGVEVTLRRGEEIYGESAELYSELEWLCFAGERFDLQLAVDDAEAVPVLVELIALGVPEPVELGSSREAATVLQPSGRTLFLAEVESEAGGFVSFAAEQGEKAELALTSVGPQGDFLAEVSGDDGLTAEARLGQGASWRAQADSSYLVRLTSTAGAASSVLFEVSLVREYDGFGIGDAVILGRHRPVDGSENWAESMETYVGQRAVITELQEMDSSGSYVVKVDVDSGDWYWRTRDMRRAPQ